MKLTTYENQADAWAEALIADLFELGGVGYVALGCGPEVLMRLHPKLQTDTTAESNFYEELLVNPTLLLLAGQRGALDCGGLDYMAIGYGEFTQLILSTVDGHVSLGVDRDAPTRELAKKVRQVLLDHGLTKMPRKRRLLAEKALDEPSC